ncbi:MAG: sialate O-acetylesterase [Acidobacteria bacterium]|nr:sialate O-acetylesterase [Acidobacteriota bacterium]
MHVRLLASLLIAALPLAAEVSLPNALSNHAVLQRDVPVRIWGWGTPKENVTVKFHDQTKTAIVDRLGAWQVMLAPEKAGGPYTLQVRGDKSVTPQTRTDILVGEVWIASGQSNMEFPLRGRPGTPGSYHPEDIAAATHPQVRILHIAHTLSAVPLWDVKDIWTLCTPQTADSLSAAAYWFALQLREYEHVPVGIIQTTWGGTPVASWTSLHGLAALNGDALKTVATDGAVSADEQGVADRIRAERAEEDQALRAAGQQVPKRGAIPGDHYGGAYTPGTLFNAMVAPLAPYTVRGVIWYQGEADTRGLRAKNYVHTFPNMIQDWRKQFANPDMAFLFVQISNLKNTNDWGSVRDAQRRALRLPNTGMAVSLDIGTPDNIHPPDKKTVGERLALAARAITYGEKDLEYAGPLFASATPQGNSMRISFTHGEGLNAKGDLGDFELQDANGNWVPATAKIDGSTIVVSAPSVTAPRAVRYGWAGEVDHYFYNKAGLPAGTFTSEK